jgi:hypothetical protein
MLARGNQWFDDAFDYDGPAVYELGTGGPRYGKIQPHYVGETANERLRMAAYARHGSHLSSTIDWHLRNDWTLYYRAACCATKKQAKEKQDNLLSRYAYDWNVQMNGSDDFE